MEKKYRIYADSDISFSFSSHEMAISEDCLKHREDEFLGYTDGSKKNYKGNSYIIYITIDNDKRYIDIREIYLINNATNKRAYLIEILSYKELLDFLPFINCSMKDEKETKPSCELLTAEKAREITDAHYKDKAAKAKEKQKALTMLLKDIETRANEGYSKMKKTHLYEITISQLQELGFTINYRFGTFFISW